MTFNGVPNAAQDAAFQIETSQIFACYLRKQVLQTIFFLQETENRILLRNVVGEMRYETFIMNEKVGYLALQRQVTKGKKKRKKKRTKKNKKIEK